MSAQRRGTTRRALASIAAGAIAVATATVGLVVAAPVASAANFTGTGVSPCHLYFGSGLPGTPAGVNSLKVSNSTFAISGLSLNPSTPNAGDTVTVTLTSPGLTAGPVQVGQGGLGLTAKVKLSGAQTDTVTLTSATAYPATVIAPDSPMGAFTLTGTFTASGSGALVASYKQLEAHDNTNSGANNFCDGTAAGTQVIAPSPDEGGTAQTTNYAAGPPVVGFKVTTLIPGVYTWSVPPTWDPLNASASSATIQATGTIGGGGGGGPTVPDAPTGLSATAGNGTVTLSWNDVTGATAYEVFRDGSKVGDPADTTYVDSGLTNGTEYSYTVKAKNEAGTSPASGAVTATPSLALPAAPTGLSAAPGDSKVTLTWVATPSATSYEVYRGASKIGTPATENFVDTGVSNGTEYSYTVKAVNASGVGPASAAVTATPKAAPKSSVEVTWQCKTLTQTLPWTTTMSASLTGTALNVAFTPGPKSGPVAIADKGLKPTAIAVAGSADVNLEGPLYGPIGVYAIVPGTTMTGTATGPLESVQIKQVKFLDVASGSNIDTTCTSTATVTVPVVTSVALPPTLPESNGELTIAGTVSAGSEVTLSGEGFGPDSPVTAGMYSDPVTLGVATADGDGKVSIKVTVPSGATGSHTFVLLGTDVSGGQWVLAKAVTIAASASPTPSPTPTDSTDPDPDNDGGLPQTGPEDLGMMLLWGAVALQVGLIVAVRASRSRRPAASGRHRS